MYAFSLLGIGSLSLGAISLFRLVALICTELFCAVLNFAETIKNRMIAILFIGNIFVFTISDERNVF
jgi:hypothetical protein